MPEQGLLDALVLAGSRRGEDDSVARAAGVSRKAFAPAGGRPMVERVAGALLDHPRIDRIDIALAGGADACDGAPRLRTWIESGRVRATAPAPSPAGTVAASLAGRGSDRDLLVTTADHALLDAVILDRFLAGSDVPGYDVFAALLPLPLLQARYPRMRRTGLGFRDGRYAGCNLFRIRPGSGAEALVAFWRSLETQRKKPWRMALAVGFPALAAYGLRRMSLARAFGVIGARAGGRAAPVVLDVPEAAIDVDTPEDLAFVERILKSRH